MTEIIIEARIHSSNDDLLDNIMLTKQYFIIFIYGYANSIILQPLFDIIFSNLVLLFSRDNNTCIHTIYLFRDFDLILNAPEF